MARRASDRIFRSMTFPTPPARRPSPPSADAAWRAVVARDARWDGRFVYAVASTRIFCRPSCPSRRPRRDRVRFFGAVEDAAAAGYRACRRCRPADAVAPTANAAVLRARAAIEAAPDAPHTLASLARAAGLSPSQLQRAFTRALGVSPRQYRESLRMRTLKSRLRDGASVGRAASDAGFGSSSRLYARADASLGMRPGAYRRGGAGTRIAFTTADAPLGRLLVAATDAGVCAVALGDDDAALEAELRAEFPAATVTRDEGALGEAVAAVVARLAGHDAPQFPLDARGTAFQQRVWQALRAIPAGETRSYAELAAALGHPSAARAVARACATNRIAVAIPCHRVVRGDGGMGGYRWGVERKKRMLEVERGSSE